MTISYGSPITKMNIESMADRQTLLSVCCVELLKRRELRGSDLQTEIRLDNCLFILATEGPENLWIGTPLEFENRKCNA